MGTAKSIAEETRAALRAYFEQAPFVQDGWNLALRALAQQTGSSRCQLIAIGQEHIPFDWVSDIPDGFGTDASQIEIYNPKSNYRVASTGPTMEVTWEAHYDQARAIHTDEAYLALTRKYDFEHGAQIVLSRQPGAFFGLALLRGHSEGRTSELDREILSQTAPFVLSAIRTQESIEHAGTQLLRGSLETLDTAAILLDGLGQVCFASTAAQALLGPHTLQIKSGILRATQRDTERHLGRRIGCALAGIDPGAADIWIRGEKGLILIDVRPLPAPAWHLGSGARVIVTLRSLLHAPKPGNPDSLPQVRQQQIESLSRALHLTPSESEVTCLIAQGLSRRDIAMLRNVSPQTVNTQLRTIFQKCAVNRESELATMARSILEMLS